MEFWASILTLTFGTTRTAESSLCSPAALYAQGNSLELFAFTDCSEPTPWLLNADRRNRYLENFQGTYQESNPKPSTCGLKQMCLSLQHRLLHHLKETADVPELSVLLGCDTRSVGIWSPTFRYNV